MQTKKKMIRSNENVSPLSSQI